jgi:hypothetical protein
MEITGELDESSGSVKLRTLDLSKPTVFSVPLSLYAYQPWSNRHPNLSQWFNYGLTPTTWTAYCQQQLTLSANKHGSTLQSLLPEFSGAATASGRS